MSASLVKQSLEIVDTEHKSKGNKKTKKEKFGLLPEQLRITSKKHKKSGKAEKIGLPIEKKYTIQEAKQKIKSKKEILELNLRKLDLMRAHSRIVLDGDSTIIIFERAVTRRPIVTKETKESKNSESAFTEEDFQKFEKDYLNS